ncbi:methylated-DNA--[protein]-cysteine S-methyltransferase [Neobacillus sp. OS1-32]|uniref:Methylated-DNA--protein-cysteine methyltransferase n=1 Tax=Neobacillus paridis TaxID=2803862 RepID=A0ABS1TPC3_9BACI|nr:MULTISPECIES: methylated-DNA--[protein]-cysteine S-methyltransferase [Neobacillus]MBL4952438.1 methylated-DNA--[protein]-cysteine S-methyltransferase [Neobacillus paridis]WML32035.1 methylated-DNA--[protein]-cysteine S-methyltransferase [Neobacillus sp. OS1-32]
MKSQEKTLIYWSIMNYKDWNLYLAATPKGLCYVGSPNKPFEELAEWIKKHIPNSTLIEDSDRLQPYARELSEYLEGKRKDFTIKSDYHGTKFQQAVWNALCEIPYGETKSYSDIANLINKPSAVRAVGAAIGANPVLMTVPCHRVIGKDGKLTGFRGGLNMKERLLNLERQSK